MGDGLGVNYLNGQGQFYCLRLPDSYWSTFWCFRLGKNLWNKRLKADFVFREVLQEWHLSELEQGFAPARQLVQHIGRVIRGGEGVGERTP